MIEKSTPGQTKHRESGRVETDRRDREEWAHKGGKKGFGSVIPDGISRYRERMCLHP